MICFFFCWVIIVVIFVFMSCLGGRGVGLVLIGGDFGLELFVSLVVFFVMGFENLR